MEKIINKKLITVSYPVEEEDRIALAVTGSSGAMLGAMVALKLKSIK